MHHHVFQLVLNLLLLLALGTLVGADYINKIKCMDNNSQPTAGLTEKYNPDNYFTVVAEQLEVYNIDKLGPTTGTVFQIVANNNNSHIKINTLFDTGAMKSVMSFDTYQKLKLDELNTASILHIVGASGESLGTRGRTRCKVNINDRTFFQTFIVCEHLK